MIPWLNNLMGLLLPMYIVVLAYGYRLPGMGAGSWLHASVHLIDCCFCAAFALLWVKWSEFLAKTEVPPHRVFRGVFRALGSAVLMTAAAVVYLFAHHSPAVRWIAVLVGTIVFFWSCIQFLLLRSLQSTDAGKRRVLILGTGRRASKAWREIRTRQSAIRELVGFVDERRTDQMAPDIAARFVADAHHLRQFLLGNAVDELLVAVPMRTCYDLAQECISIAEAAGIRVLSLGDIYTLSHSAGLSRKMDPYIELVPQNRAHHLRQKFKRCFDFTVALALLILGSPFFAVIGMAVKLSSNGPVFSIEERYGYRLRRFRMYRFRTMTQKAAAPLAEVRGRHKGMGPMEAPSITPVGQWLRRWSLDELPQLINVIRGEMSLVGPRPVSKVDMAQFSEVTAMRRFSIRPGITGIWQVAGRDSSDFDEWMELDSHYIEHWSLHLDFKILARTLPAVLKSWGTA